MTRELTRSPLMSHHKPREKNEKKSIFMDTKKTEGGNGHPSTRTYIEITKKEGESKEYRKHEGRLLCPSSTTTHGKEEKVPPRKKGDNPTRNK